MPPPLSARAPHLQLCVSCRSFPHRCNSRPSLSIAVGAPVTRRFIQIQATPASSQPEFNNGGGERDAMEERVPPVGSPDARFEVVGSPSSLLSVSLSASQNLFTRRGTLASVSGKPENVTSTLSVLSPLRRSPLGVPFLYQKISSTTPLNLLVSSTTPNSTFVVIHLDGRIDWIVAQRNGLIAWTGHSLAVRPKVNMKMSLAHWGNTQITGRGLVALEGKGQIYQVVVRAGEEYIVHPSHVLAYTVTPSLPLPYRFRSLRLQIPSFSLGALVPDTKFFRAMSGTQTWRNIVRATHTLRTWLRRTIWGDRLFLHFRGPCTLLLHSRPGGAARALRESMSPSDINAIADSPAGEVHEAVKLDLKNHAGTGASGTVGSAGAGKEVKKPTEKVSYATVEKDGRVKWEESGDKVGS
ncbi:mitochondrial biogenesis AIM24-domain-containing protein [Lineolata rhizophorae]|uniref:Altered inheritance of mitochondria protein 24, mitochondrial n=1 Tax=Lineolata rhizophorae TaxID=578093 RepID=A0A6A6P1S2_9PEZI|nr:mitochondrial biogenesis AIM24-domain-containing protein [Lineolata rhizophorae]